MLGDSGTWRRSAKCNAERSPDSGIHTSESGAECPARLAILSDGRRPEPGPILSFGLSIQAILAIVTLNPVAPFEIAVPTKCCRRAAEQLAKFLGFDRNHGAAIFKSLDEARKAVHPRSRMWSKIALTAVGGGLLVAAPVGLFMAVPAGVYGAAAVATAVSAFGPGGIVGGLVTAGALLGAGGTTIGAALASPLSLAEALERVVVEQLAGAIAGHKLKGPTDSGPWFALCELEAQITHVLQQLEPYSDPQASSIRLLRRKADAVRRAINYMADKRLISTLPAYDDDRPGESGSSRSI